MSRDQLQIKNVLQSDDRLRAVAMSHCPHCGESLEAEARPEPIRWYIADDGAPLSRVSTLGAKLRDSIRTNGQAVYVSPDGGKTVRRMGIAAAPNGERIPTEEREPIIVPPHEFARNWRRIGRGGAR